MINADIISLRLSHDMDPVGINTRFFSKLIRSAWEPSRHAGKPCPDIEVAAGYHRFDIGFVSPQGTFLSFNNHPSYQGLYDVVVKSGMYEKTIVTVTEQQRATLYRRGYPPHDNRVVDALLFAIEDLGIYLVNSPTLTWAAPPRFDAWIPSSIRAL